MTETRRIYTKAGDQGETSLGNGARVAKSSARIEAFGEVEEANAAIGLARLEASAQIDAVLARIQNDLFDLGMDLAMPISETAPPTIRIMPAQITRLEELIDALAAELAPLADFVLPMGSPTAVRLYMARAVVRRAERAVVRLLEAPEEAVNRLLLVYLNRLSDLLFMLARAANGMGGADIVRGARS